MKNKGSLTVCRVEEKQLLEKEEVEEFLDELEDVVRKARKCIEDITGLDAIDECKKKLSEALTRFH